jgi:hypothetical protein
MLNPLHAAVPSLWIAVEGEHLLPSPLRGHSGRQLEGNLAFLTHAEIMGAFRWFQLLWRETSPTRVAPYGIPMEWAPRSSGRQAAEQWS